MKKKILMVGESPLIEEYSSLCREKGYAVDAGVNGRKASAFSKSAALAIELTNIDADVKKKNLARLDKILVAKTIIISSSTTVTVAEQATWLKHPDRLVGVGALPSLLSGNLMEFAASEHTRTEAKRAAEEFASSLGKECAFVQDSVGLVMPRILCALANEACFAMMEGVAEGKDIDTAMKLGTNYPRGPVEWAERIGWRNALAVMNALHEYFGEDRYRPAPVLRANAWRSSSAH